jgi:hypothetical protein
MPLAKCEKWVWRSEWGLAPLGSFSRGTTDSAELIESDLKESRALAQKNNNFQETCCFPNGNLTYFLLETQ